MKLSEISKALRTRAEALDLTPADVAHRAGCSTEDVSRALSGDSKVTAGALLGVAEALGYVAVVVPLPAEVAVAAGSAVTEPKVLTKVAAALATLSPPRVALFLDFDGVLSPVGASRIDDRGQLVGEGLFRWWPRLREVLEDHPDVQVVVHSSWRKFWPSLEWLRPLLPPDLAERVVGITDPDVNERHKSIESYLAVHPEVTAYVVLDDEDEGFSATTNLVRCHPQHGLGDARVVAKLREALVRAKRRQPQFTHSSPGPDFCPDLDKVLAHLQLGDRSGLSSLHRSQDLQSFLMHREAVRLLRTDPTLGSKVEATLARWTSGADINSLPLLKRWAEIAATRDWDSALANTDHAQQLRQASPLAGLVPESTRLAIIHWVMELTRAA